VLGDHGIRQRAAAWRQPEALLQQRERQSLALVGLLQEGEHQLKRRHPHRDIQRLDHQSGRAVTVSADQELLPEVPPAFIREKVPLVAAMEQRPRFGA